MPAATRRHARHSSSEGSDPGIASTSLPTRGGPARSRGDAGSSDSEVESDEQLPAVEVAFQSNMAARIPDEILAALNSMRRNMELNFRALQETIREQRVYTNKRFDDTDKRFDKTDDRFDKMDIRFDKMDDRFDKMDIRFDKMDDRSDKMDNRFSRMDKRLDASSMKMKAHNANRGATHIHSSIQPVGRWSEVTEQMLFPDRYPTRVHEFLRLKTRSKCDVLANLLRFYDIQSWPTWGVYPVWPDDESDTEELLAPKHRSLEEAIQYAPEIALQELAIHIGLDYDRITANRDEDERQQESREILRKRRPTEVPITAKRGKSSRGPAHEQAATRFTQQPVAARPKTDSMSSHAEIGWDTRRTEDRTPPDMIPRVQDARGYETRKLSLTSVATSE